MTVQKLADPREVEMATMIDDRTTLTSRGAGAVVGEGFPILRRTEHEATMMVQGNLAHNPWLVQMARVILDQLEDPQLQKLIVDMNGVTDFNIQSVAWWVGLERFVREHERTMVIVNASPVVYGVLQRMGIDR